MDDLFDLNDVIVYNNQQVIKYLVSTQYYEESELMQYNCCIITDSILTAWDYIEQRLYQYYNICAVENHDMNDFYIRIDVDGVRIASNLGNYLSYTIKTIPYIN